MKQAKEFSSPAELKKYLHEHPGADAHKHTVKRPDGGSGSGAARTKTKVDKGVADEIARVWKNKPSSNGVDAVRKMIEDGKEISVNLLGRAVSVLKGEMSKATGQEKKDLKSLHDKLKGEMHKEANSKVAFNVAGRFVTSRL